MHNAAENDSPLVSVIIPTYNRGKYLRQCIESALSQDYPNLEVIVVDNGSTDNTPEILTSFGKRIKCLEEEKKGPGAARNKGIEVSRGEFIAFLDSDDYYLPGKITLSVRKLLPDQSAAIIYTDYIRIDTESRSSEEVKLPYPPREQFARQILVRGLTAGSSVVMRKRCFEKIGYFNENFLANEDVEMWLRLLKAGCCFDHIPKPLYVYRWHSDNISHDKKLARSCSDRVRTEAVRNFTAQELFGDLIKKNDWNGIKTGYEKMARKFYRSRFFAAAEAALEKTAAIKEPSPRLSLSMPILKMKIAFQKHRKRTLLIQNK